ncbi:hypothetical protein E2C01_038386 [Portunus trituberculatus]|uniref:Cuticle protein 6 n=1 Tax=Portunus trituberculatus TaxID=210409 RepID=A0A5B7FGN6_PORTR|nr:hypothetical protein [Portunus trituberculatus]
MCSSSHQHYTRCPLSCPVRIGVWLWAWAWTCVVLSAAQGTGAGQGTILQDFPIAAEENFYSFNPDGTYTFSYDTGGGEHQSFRIEMRDASGRVSGRFGYVDPAGALRITEYQADSSGYRASIEVYHQVSLAPPTPLIVGPVPKEPTVLPDPPADPPKPRVMHPVGPAPFFPPQQPVLIIGPLPKPLQPESAEDDHDPPDLNEDSLLTVPSDPLIPAVFPKSPLGDASPGDLFNSPLETEGISILQGNFTDIPQLSSDDLEDSPNSNVTDTLQVSYDERGAKSESKVAETSLPVFMTKKNDDSRSQSRRFRNLPPIPPTPLLTYLPVGAPRHQYPTAPLLQLPQEANSYPA